MVRNGVLRQTEGSTVESDVECAVYQSHRFFFGFNSLQVSFFVDDPETATTKATETVKAIQEKYSEQISWILETKATVVADIKLEVSFFLFQLEGTEIDHGGILGPKRHVDDGGEFGKVREKK